MIEIILIAIVVLMAQHPKRRGSRRYNLRKVTITPALALGTLTAGTVITTGLTGTSDAQYRLISADMVWTMHNHTAGEGPISVGYAFGDYTVTEIKEALENAISISPGNKIFGERAGRWVRKIGQFSGNDPSEVLNDGKPIKTRLNWAVQIGSVVNMFAYNNDTNDFATGTVVGAMGNLWVKDY